MKVSIGLPFYNNRATLGDAIRSVFSQTFSDWELILVDDGSTDGSLELAQGLCDSRVRVFRDGINRGLPARLNQIAGLARGHYLARMDGDDLMHPERLAHQVEVLDRNKDAELAGTAIFSLDRSGRPRGMRGVAHPDSSPLGVLKGVPLVHATLMARTDWFRLHPYDENRWRAEDHELFVRVVRDLRFEHLNEPLYFVCEEQAGYLQKYLATGKADRAIFRAYGPGLVGWPRTAALCLLSKLKGEIYRMCTHLQMEHLLVRRRNAPLTVGQAAAAMEVIERIRATPVPGLLPAAVGITGQRRQRDQATNGTEVPAPDFR